MKKLLLFITLSSTFFINAINENWPKVLAHLQTTNFSNINHVDEEGNLLLMKAIRENRIDLVRFLIEHGANINIQGRHGITPLYRAIDDQNMAIAHLLLEHGADVNAPANYGYFTPLMQAIDQGSLDLTHALLEYGANVNRQSKDEQDTPLMYAMRGKIHIVLDFVRLLLEYGADINLKDKYGKTALHYAIDLAAKHHYSGYNPYNDIIILLQKDQSWFFKLKTQYRLLKSRFLYTIHLITPQHPQI